MQTTITVNGPDGDRFLAHLGMQWRAEQLRVPQALLHLAQSEDRSIDVDAAVADAAASFVAELLDAGWIDVAAPPLLFSPRIGDIVAIARDMLVEIEQHGSPTWVFLKTGLRGRLSDWLPHGIGRVVITDGTRFVARIRRGSMTRVTMRPDRRAA